MFFIVKKKTQPHFDVKPHLDLKKNKKKCVIFIFLKRLNLNPSRPTTIQVASWTIIEKKPSLSLSKGL
jgi:hypothetical protein